MVVGLVVGELLGGWFVCERCVGCGACGLQCNNRVGVLVVVIIREVLEGVVVPC